MGKADTRCCDHAWAGLMALLQISPLLEPSAGHLLSKNVQAPKDDILPES